MAILNEIQAKLSSMSEVEFVQFKTDLGGGGSTREWYVTHFRDNSSLKPGLEARYCQLLGLATEAEKAGQYAAESLEVNRRAAAAAETSARAAWVAAVISILALILSIIALIKSW